MINIAGIIVGYNWKGLHIILLLLIFTALPSTGAMELSGEKEFRLFQSGIEERKSTELYFYQKNKEPAVPDSVKNPHVVFLISKDPDNYEAHNTIPQFAEMLNRKLGYEVTVILGEGNLTAFNFPELEVLSEADLLVIFFRRVALPGEQLEMIKSYLREGKPLVGIRTANHAFSVREELPVGYESWWEFVPNILGCENRGYGSIKEGTEVAIVPDAKDHFILMGIEPEQWHSIGNVYHVAPLNDTEATILLTGKAGGKIEPVAWTRRADKSKVFYTSLGHPEDFQLPQFRNILIRGIRWALEE